MTILALRTSRRCNGVSHIHGRVSRAMWTSVWPEAPVQEIPIGLVTNGIHIQTWLAPEMRSLYDRCFGKDWQYRINDTEMWQNETFDAATIDRELAWAEGLGYNSCRVFVQYIVGKADPVGL